VERNVVSAPDLRIITWGQVQEFLISGARKSDSRTELLELVENCSVGCVKAVQHASSSLKMPNITFMHQKNYTLVLCSIWMNKENDDEEVWIFGGYAVAGGSGDGGVCTSGCRAADEQLQPVRRRT
jgi:hypothetical protein